MRRCHHGETQIELPLKSSDGRKLARLDGTSRRRIGLPNPDEYGVPMNQERYRRTDFVKKRRGLGIRVKP